MPKKRNVERRQQILEAIGTGTLNHSEVEKRVGTRVGLQSTLYRMVKDGDLRLVSSGQFAAANGTTRSTARSKPQRQPSPTRRRVLAAIGEGISSPTALHQALPDVHKSTVNTHLTNMVKRGEIIRVAPGRYGLANGAVPQESTGSREPTVTGFRNAMRKDDRLVHALQALFPKGMAITVENVQLFDQLREVIDAG